MTATASLSHLQWRATEWILAFGPLNRQIVLDYFVLSPFFDRTSTNAALRMQMQFSRGGMEGVDEEGELTRFVGLEYVVVHAAPPALFIIHKRERTSPTEAKTVAAYYVMNDNIYQGPSLYTVINERVLTSIHALSSSLSLLRSHKPSWSSESLYAWDVRPPPASDQVAAAAAGLDADEVVPADLTTSGEDVGVETEEGSKKRARSAHEGDDEDDETLRPASAFNPLLFRALQSVAASLPVPPPPPILAQPPSATAATTTATGQGDGDATTRSEKDASVGPSAAGGAGAQGTSGDPVKPVTNGGEIRLSATGKRKPKKAN